MRFSFHIAMLLFLVMTMAGAAQAIKPPASRIGISAGMGVNYLTQRDLVDMINGGYSPGKRVDEFHAAVDFFGSVVVPLSADWALRAEFAYLLNTYNITSLLGPGNSPPSFICPHSSSNTYWLMKNSTT